jgi:predicted dehydrogenase
MILKEGFQLRGRGKKSKLMEKLRFAIVGTGFWASYQLAAWLELPGVTCVALCNRHLARAAALASRFNIASIYEDVRQMIDREELDFLDVITDVGTHAGMVRLAAAHRLPVICQKPMAGTLAEAIGMVEACRATGTPLLIHENWRWQTPIRALKESLTSGVIGRPFRARVHFCSSFPVFDNQPFLRELEQFILTDIGSHILDTARFLFGEATSLYCQTHRVHKEIKGEDVATVVLSMDGGMTVICEMSYASRTEHERFPETYVHIEGELGSLELGPGYRLCVTTSQGSIARFHPPPQFSWVDSAYELVQASIVPCNANLLAGLRGETDPETTGEDNLKTMRLVFASYESARSGDLISLPADHLAGANA